MPSEIAHIALAVHNQDVIEYLLKALDEYSDWIATVAFYKAIHLVEAVFARDSEIGHGRNHENRERFLKSKNRYSNIYRHYRPLWAASMIARYLEDERGKPHPSFSDYLSPEKVRKEMLNHRLFQIEKTAKKFLSKTAKQLLDSSTDKV